MIKEALNKFLFLKSLRLKPIEILVFIVVLASSHLFFALQKKPIAVFLCGLIIAVLHLFKKNELKKFLFIICMFFFSFWFLEIPYPRIGFLSWPIDHFIGVLILVIASKIFHFKKSNVDWQVKFSKSMLYSLVGIVVPSLICLVLYFLFHKEIAKKWPLPEIPLWAVPFAIVLIATINGLREELYFRITLQSFLIETGSASLAISCSSILFGYMHFHNGFPCGGVGVFLTTLFGLVIGIQFYYFKSVPLTWFTHLSYRCSYVYYHPLE